MSASTAPPPPDKPRWLPRHDDATGSALTTRRIVLAALDLVERKGLDALTMRAVAKVLHVTPMSLYHHVADKAELVDLMVDYIIGDIVEAAAGDTGDWECRLRALMHRNHDMWLHRPGFVKVYTEGVTMGPNGLANVELAMAILRESGLSDADAAGAFMTLYRWNFASLLIVASRPHAGARRDLAPPPTTVEERIDWYFSALPLEKIPNVKATVPYLTGDNVDFGLDIFIAGLKSRMAQADADLTTFDHFRPKSMWDDCPDG